MMLQKDHGRKGSDPQGSGRQDKLIGGKPPNDLWALQPMIKTWVLFQNFLILYTVGRTPCAGDKPVARPLPTHDKKKHTQNKRSQTSMPRVGFESTAPVFKRANKFHALDYADTLSGLCPLLIEFYRLNRDSCVDKAKGCSLGGEKIRVR
jgi:hypothetical protein